MNREQAISWLKLLGAKVPSSQLRAGWTISDCPLGPWKHEGGHSSSEVFGVKVEGGDSFCTCFSCGFHGSQTDLVIYMKMLNKGVPISKFEFGEAFQRIMQAEQTAELEGLDSPSIEELMMNPPNQLHEYPQWWLDSFAEVSHHIPWAVEYLEQRNVSFKLAKQFDLRVDTEQHRICMPVRDFQGRLMGFHGRAVNENVEPRYRMYTYAKKNNPLVWLGEAWVDVNKPVIVVEGFFDLMSVYRVYQNVVSPLFSNPNMTKLKRMGDCSEVFTLLDRGKGGDTGRTKFSLMKDSLVTHLLPPVGVKDPGEMSVEQLQNLLGEHLPLKNPLA